MHPARLIALSKIPIHTSVSVIHQRLRLAANEFAVANFIIIVVVIADVVVQ